MATTATARSPQANLHTMSETPRSPLRASHHSPTKSTTPRPSISPLSTASRPAKGSPIATRDAIMADSEIHDNAEAGDGDEPIADDLRDDRSSSLSEPDDDEDMENMPNHDVAAPVALGKLGAQKSADVDSEAETERLEESPHKMREQADGIGRTPSKLRQAAVADDELSDPPSPLPTGAGAASSTSTIGTGGRPLPNAGDHGRRFPVEDHSNALGVGQKRKRSDAEDSPLTSAESDIGESPRKRSHELALNAPEEEEQLADAHEPEELGAESVRATPGAQSGKLPKGKKGKQKGRKAKEQTEPLETEAAEETKELEEEPSEETAQKTHEELKKKGEASSNFEGLVKQFMAFRDRLVNERLATIEDELQMLSQPNCAHPEYLRQVACIEERQAKQVREAHAYYYYRMQATRERALGDRAQLHSQYFQEVRELREDVLYKLGEDWYAIQKERRQQHQDGDEKFLYMYRPKKSAQIKQQAKYNQEVSVLSGVAKYVGFPAAPNIAGVADGGLEDDLKAMKVPRRVPQPIPHMHHFPQPQPITHAPLPRPHQAEQPIPQGAQLVRSDSERRAHEQFLEQNAWARPQQSIIPAHGTPNLTHTSDWVDQPGNARTLFRNIGGQAHNQQYGQRNGSPFATPVSTKRAPSAFNSAQGQAAEDYLPSSAMAAQPSDGSESRPQEGFTGSPLMVIKQRANGNSNGNGTPHYDGSNNRERELTGFRNISNISGTSTIDAPLSAEKSSNEKHDTQPDSTPLHHLQTHDQDGFARPGPPPFREEMSAPQQVFETSALHRQRHTGESGNGRDVYGGGQFRAAEGAFGTPAPLAGKGGN